MITNERQYRITRSQAQRFAEALADFDRDPPKGVDPIILRAQRDALKGQLDDLLEELKEFDRLRAAADLSVISASSFDELADGLIKARIAAGISQKELAERLGLKEQQVQRYEAERYSSASYRRLQDIAGALGVRIRNDILLPVSAGDFQGVVNKLRQVGIDRSFLLSRLLPAADAARALGEVHGESEDALLANVVSALTRVFGWTRANLLGEEPLASPRFAAAEARFKMPARRVREETGLYAAYANYLAIVVLTASRSLPRSAIPTDAETMRMGIVGKYGDLTLSTALHFAWDLGVPILPQRDRGTFHSACWRYDGRNVVVLKQTSKHEARWLFDLLHELYHAGQKPDADTMEVLEADETSDERRQSDEEIAASQFAGDVMLDGRAEDLAQACVRAAKGSVERLKKAVPEVAARERVGVGALANYMAFRLSWQNINWWGAAANLQVDNTDPWRIARDTFFARFPFEIEDALDRHLLERALQ